MVSTYKVNGMRLGITAKWRVDTVYSKNEVFYLHIFNSLAFFLALFYALVDQLQKENGFFIQDVFVNNYVFRRMKNFRSQKFRINIFCYPLRLFFLIIVFRV